MFSAQASSAVTRTGASTSGSAAMAASTAPAPAMSVFIGIIASAGLIDRPPVSNVMPLPTSTTWGHCAEPGGR